MTEQQIDRHDDEQARQIEDGFRRLGTALAPPPDVAVRVERRIRERRARRRTVVGVAGVVVAAAVGGAALVGGGDGDGTTIASDQPSGPSGSFVLTRPDGSTYEFTDLTVSCDAPFGGADPAAGSPQRIWLHSPQDLDDSGEKLLTPFLYFEAIVDKVDGQTFQLPYDTEDSSDTRAFTLFAADATSAAPGKRANEVSSAEPGATGTVQVRRASCGPRPVLELEVHTTLGSELQQGTLDLTGSFG